MTINTENLLGYSRFLAVQEASHINSDLLQAGIYSPLIVSANTLVWGHHILQAAVNTKIPTLHCVDPQQAPHELLLTFLACENRINGYTFDEKLHIFKTLQTLEHTGFDFRQKLSRLIQSKGDFYTQFEQVQHLPELLLSWIALNWIDVKLAQKISLFDTDIIEALSEFIYKLSFSERRILLSNLAELALKDKDYPILETVQFLRVLDNPLAKSHELRYPKLHAMQKEFENYLHRHKTAGLRISAPQYFEGSAFSFSAELNSSKQLNTLIQTLTEMKKDIHELFSLLQ